MADPVKVLVVDDERPLAHALEIKLKAAGFYVRTASDGEEALKAMGEEDFNLVLLDLIMPKLDGFGVLQRLKDRNIRTPIIVASNLGQDTDIKRSLQLGAVDYFTKSNISISDIIQKIKARLGIKDEDNQNPVV